MKCSGYASLFPDHVDKMVIDGNMNVTVPFRPIAFQGNIYGRQYVYDNIIIPYIAQNPQKYNLGSSESAIQAYFPKYDMTLKNVVRNNFTSSIKKQSNYENSAAIVVAATGIYKLLQNFPDASQSNLLQKLKTYVFTNDKKTNSIIQTEGIKLLNDYYMEQEPLKPFVSRNSVHFIITCNDTTSNLDPEFWNNLGDQMAKAYPLSGGGITANNCTKVWGNPTTIRPPLVNATKIPKILMVQTQYDAQTPLDGAIPTFKSLPNAEMVYVQNDYSHGTFPYNTECVDGTIAEYLITGKTPIEKDHVHNCIGRKILSLSQKLSKENQDDFNWAYKNKNEAIKTENAIYEVTSDAEANIN